MSSRTRDAHKHAKARRRRYRTAHERLARDRRQAQHAADTPLIIAAPNATDEHTEATRAELCLLFEGTR